tara:strand:+ start:14162 stop:14764 length:603 start_codon:yes stop_codon:yes gene_type:complete
MKEYLFSENELELIKILKSNPPKKIWWEPIFYIFEYDNFFIELGIECAEKINLGCDSEKMAKNTPISDLEQYVMIAKLKRVNHNFKPQIGSELLIVNEKITELNIVRTLLFYCQHKQSQDRSHLFYLDSSQINPKLEISKELKIERTFLADVGLWIRCDNKILNCFIIDNDDDFSTNSLYSQNDNLKQDKKEFYSFIETD